MKLLRLFPVLALLLIPSFATAASEHISSFDSAVSISHANVATVTETISYDFGDIAHHGIFRFVPADYLDDAGNRYYTTVHYMSVTRDGQKEPYSVTSSSGNVQAKIGNADSTTTGSHIYRISYTITPLINQKDGQDHLAFDVTGNGWDVPIEHVTAKVSYDQDTVATQSLCFVGVQGSTEQSGCEAAANTMSTNRALRPGEGLTIEQFLPAGSFAAYLQPNVRRPFDWSSLKPYLGLLPGILALLAGGTRFAIRLWRQSMRKRAQTIVPQYEAPDGLSPGEIGLLIDDKSSMPEITATLIDLAVRGYIRIEQLKPSGLFIKKPQYRLVKLKPYDDARDYEQTLLTAIFAKGDTVELSDLDKSQMQVAIFQFESTLQTSLEAKGYYSGKLPSSPSAFFKSFGKWTIAVIIGFVILIMISKVFILVAFGYVAWWFAGQVGRLTPGGLHEWAEVRGFKWYLSMVEKDRLKFTDAPDKNPERFSKLLPFAIALGVEKQWAKQFEGIDVSASTGWYSSYNGGFIVPYALASDLSGGFASTMQANSTVSSGGGGGISGGGFGGGGGGSW